MTHDALELSHGYWNDNDDLLRRATLTRSHFASIEVRRLKWFADLDKLPVGGRYRLDCMAFVEREEALYYATVGNGVWLDSLVEQACRVRDLAGTLSSRHSRVVSGEDV